MLRMGRYEKKKKSFTERTDGTVAPFPDLDRGALSFVLDAFESREKGKEIKFGYDISDYAKKQFLEFLEKKNFAQLYAVTIEEFKPIEDDLLKITEGEWRVYPRGSDPKQLVESIAPYGTGWCLRGEATAGRYLVRDNNELQVFYSLDKEGKATVPRVVTVVNENNQLREVRGVAVEENLDQYIGDVVREKLKEFPDGVVYEKKSRDMKELTALSKKKERGEDLAKEDLRFLYEIEAKIKGFGYQRDPRIEEIKSTRNFEKDIETLCGCEPEYIAKNFTDITENTEVFCNIKGNNITIFDYRLPENKAKLQSHIEFLKNKKESGSIAELDLNLEGGVANISIDRSKSMQELIDAGNYDYVDPMLIKAFPNIEAGPSNLEVAFVRFNKDINGEEVIAELDKLGLRPVTASKLCAIGATFPELQQKQTLISLGSKTSVGDGLMVLYLLEFDAERVADLIPWDGDWRSDSCFPAVRK